MRKLFLAAVLAVMLTVGAVARRGADRFAGQLGGDDHVLAEHHHMPADDHLDEGHLELHRQRRQNGGHHDDNGDDQRRER